MMSEESRIDPQEVAIPISRVTLHGTFGVPDRTGGVVLFAHGSGSGRFSARNRFVAGELHNAGFATLLFDLLTDEEERVDAQTAHLRFDIGLLAERLVAATDWIVQHPTLGGRPVGYFGASTGAGAALVAAARRPNRVGAVVSRGGRPDLARPVLTQVRAPTLLIVGGLDTPVIQMNEDAMTRMIHSHVRLEIIPGATHLFEEPGTLERVAELARDWFARHLAPSTRELTPASAGPPSGRSGSGPTGG